jgi:hypothetical protein
MSFWILLCIMLITGITGGVINYLMPANASSDTGKFIRPVLQCIILGIGATLLVPLFLEIAQSKILDNIYFDFALENPNKSDSTKTMAHKTDTFRIINTVDTSKHNLIKSDTSIGKDGSTDKKKSSEQSATAADPGKKYLLFVSYCLLAAVAGFRFINMLLKNVVKEDEVNSLRTENKSLLEQKSLQDTQNKMEAKEEEQKVNIDVITKKIELAQETGNSSNLLESIQKTALLPIIGPITHPDDPQKGRFGGKSISNNRQLKAEVESSLVPSFYNVKISVESTNPEKYPLTGEVIFYIHDSFRPSVYSEKVINNVATDNDILSYGAFTVGAVADGGQTLLELDLAEDPKFPKEFRER